MIRLNPSVRALSTSLSRAVRMAGHQVWMVSASRVASGSWASIAGFVEVGQPPPDLRRLPLAEEEPEPFFHRPRGLDFLGRVTGVE